MERIKALIEQLNPPMERFSNMSKPWDNLPKFSELPSFGGLPGCAWEVWGKGDELGTVNMLTDEVVARAAREEIKTGQRVILNWPVNFPAKALFHRKSPEHTIISGAGVTPRPANNDDILHINTQSGTQWDGLRHFGIFSEACFYQGVKSQDLPKGVQTFPDPRNVDKEAIKLGIHSWAQHGICGRGVFVDMVKYYTENGTKPLPYDPLTTYSIPVEDITAAAEKQGIHFRQADILILRVGFLQRFNAASQEERDAMSGINTFAGIQQDERMKEFLWDNHFAAIASDQPSMEAWPAKEPHLHQTLIGLWGMPIGEYFDVEALAKVAHETGRYTFFFSSWPLNVLGGVASPPNAAAIF